MSGQTSDFILIKSGTMEWSISKFRSVSSNAVGQNEKKANHHTEQRYNFITGWSKETLPPDTLVLCSLAKQSEVISSSLVASDRSVSLTNNVKPTGRSSRDHPK
ncbi:hypothetical protein L596_024543 [Steinernema carpocapsae]|uniref:Uncharacterized protein n=1 Tax=Steinernema carpocapsae TaxID=34508 RepID=A0A4U5MH21_STECR|nr:hypothetical protein L596_024543 [Steinernema carpocapsae]